MPYAAQSSRPIALLQAERFSRYCKIEVEETSDIAPAVRRESGFSA
jgi:hypothetical protein